MDKYAVTQLVLLIGKSFRLWMIDNYSQRSNCSIYLPIKSLFLIFLSLSLTFKVIFLDDSMYNAAS